MTTEERDAERVDAALAHLRETRFDEAGMRFALLTVLREARARAVAVCMDAKRRHQHCPKRRALAQAIADTIKKDSEP